MKNSVSQKNYSSKKFLKNNIKSLVHHYDDEEYVDIFSEAQLKKKVELFRKKSEVKK